MLFALRVNVKVYLYEKCGTCQKAIKWLEGRGIVYQNVPIKETPPTHAEFERMLRVYEGNLRSLFNTSGLEYKRLNLKDRLPTLSQTEALELLSSNGMLVKRPFVLTDKGGAVGFKEAEWAKLFP